MYREVVATANRSPNAPGVLSPLCWIVEMIQVRWFSFATVLNDLLNDKINPREMNRVSVSQSVKADGSVGKERTSGSSIRQAYYNDRSHAVFGAGYGLEGFSNHFGYSPHKQSVFRSVGTERYTSAGNGASRCYQHGHTLTLWLTYVWHAADFCLVPIKR